MNEKSQNVSCMEEQEGACGIPQKGIQMKISGIKYIS